MSEKSENLSSGGNAFKSASSLGCGPGGGTVKQPSKKSRKCCNSNTSGSNNCNSNNSSNNKKRKGNSGQKMQKSDCDTNQDQYRTVMTTKETKSKCVRDQSIRKSSLTNKKVVSDESDDNNSNGPRAPADEEENQEWREEGYKMHDSDDESEETRGSRNLETSSSRNDHRREDSDGLDGVEAGDEQQREVVLDADQQDEEGKKVPSKERDEEEVDELDASTSCKELLAGPADANSNCKSTKCDETNTISNNTVNKKKFKDETTGEWICPVCDTKLDSQHSFTVHIRQHNPTDHSHTCSICGKTLSSASSLDRHMLIHSGERPFKCRICNMAFTTNGNMHRHMRTHGMELNDHDSHDSNNNRFKSKKRKNQEDSASAKDSRLSSHACSSPKNRRQSDGDVAININNSEKEEHHCHVCGKGFSSKSMLHTHMESHPNDPISCRECGGVFGNYALFTQHHCASTIFNGANKCGLPSSPQAGFCDLTFTDFSSTKFSLIAKSFCEHNARKTSSQYHDFECNKCERAFPCGSALNLHQTGHKGETYCQICHIDLGTPALYLSHQLKHRSGMLPSLNGVSSPHNFVNSVNGVRDKSAFSEITRGDKEGFLAMLQLQNKSSDSSLSPPLRLERNEDAFENPSYYIHAKPMVSKKPITFKPKIVNGGSDVEHVKHDLADIQSIISVTSTATPLITQIRSSPPAASPASPVQAGIGQTEPDSPVPADSPNESATLVMPGGRDNASEEEKTEGENEGKCSEEEKKREKEGSEKESNDKSAGLFRCTICNLEFKSANSLKRHNRGHVQGGHSYACNTCTYTSLDKSTLVRHLRTHNGERPFQCAICKYAFTTKANCERHVRKRHKKTAKHEIRSSMQYNSDMAATVGTSNLTIQNLSKHNSLPINSEYPTGNETVCKYCNVDFKYNRVLRHHLRSLQNSCHRKPYTCSACKLGFSTKNNCVRHVVKQHPELREKLPSLVSANGSSTASNSPSYLSESESVNTMDGSSQRWSQDSSLMSSSAFQYEQQQSLIVAQQGHSSLAALCQIAGTVARLESEPLNLASGSEEYDGDESNDNIDEQPLDLAKSLSKASSDEEDSDQPLDLALHALDLSVKPKKPCSSETCSIPDTALHSETVRNAATSLLALQSSSIIVPRPDTFIPSTSLLYANIAKSPLQTHPSSILPVAHPPPPPPPQSPLPPPTVPLATTSVEEMYRLSTFRVAKSPVTQKNQRSFTCIYCSAGFTLKSNMERHIKRKHPEHARPPRARGSSSSISSGKEIGSTNGAVSLLSKPTGTTLSSKTRAALRVVLSNKALGSSANSTVINTATTETNGSRCSTPPSEIHVNETNQSLDDVGGDLASVSSLIADTANSSNTLKQYFDKANESESKPENQESSIISIPETNAIRPEDNINTSSNENIENTEEKPSSVPKKRSAYTDSPNSVSCPYCARKFPWTSSLRRHILTHTGLKPFKCPKCPILFTTKSNCERHLVRKHGGDSRKSSKSDIPSPFPQETRQYKCTSCVNTYFPTQGSLKKHFYLRHLTKSNNGPSLLKSRASGERSEGNQNIPEENGGPNKTFELLFKCHVCTASFTERTECLSHIESCHSVDYKTLLAKGEIDKVRTSETKLILAIKSGEVSSNAKKIYCVFCPRQFMTDENLKRHMKVHLGERPYKCILCTKRFSLKNSLLRHYRTNHPNDPRALKAKVKRRVKALRVTEEKLKEDTKDNPAESIPLEPSQAESKSPKEANSEDTNDGGELIQNLLGIQDKNMLDEMLNSADSAARLLGVKEALQTEVDQKEGATN